MKKIIFFIPAIISGVFVLGVAFSLSFSLISPIAILWMGLLTLSGILLSKGLFQGGLFGVLPGIHLVYMSAEETGQVINIELPMGIFVISFYLLCCVFVYRRSRKIII